MKRAVPGPLWRTGEVVDGRYEVIRLAGEGGMGRVYQVRHLHWGIDLAVKQPHADVLRSPGSREQFVEEAEAWISLGLHPNLCCCHYVRQFDGLPMVFAEYVPGGSLRNWITDGRLYAGPNADVLLRILDIAVQFAWGLEHSHHRGLVHQDVKPDNVLLDTANGDIGVKVTDFGLARARAGGRPRTFRIVGRAASAAASIVVSRAGLTPAYASPEQAAGAELSQRTDVYSYAVSVLEMFTGERLWRTGGAAEQSLKNYLAAGGARPGKPAMPPALGALLERCLRHDPSERPRSMADIADEIARIYQWSAGNAFPRIVPRAADLRADELNNRAVSLLDLQRTAEAEEMFATARKADPRHLAATYNSGLLRWRRGLITDEEVLTQIRAVSEPAVDSLLARCLCANIHLERGDTVSAQAIIDDIEQGKRNQPEVEAVQRALTAGRCAEMSVSRTTVPSKHPASSFNDQWLSFRYSRDGARMVTGHKSGVLRLWETRTGKILHTCTVDSGSSGGSGSGEVKHVDISADGRIGVGSIDYRVLIWDFATGKLSHEFVVDRPDDQERGTDLGIDEVHLSPDGNWAFVSATGLILSAGRVVGAQILAWDLRTGERSLWQRLDGFSAYARFEVAADGTHLFVATANRGESVSGAYRQQLVNLARRERRVLANLTDNRAEAMTFTTDGRWAVFMDPDRLLRVWDLRSGQCVREIPGPANVRTLAVSDDARWALSGGYDKARLWDLAAGRCLRTFEKEGSAGAVWQSPDALTGGAVAGVAGEHTFMAWSFRPPAGYLAPPQLSRPRHVLEISRLGSEADGLIREAEQAITDQRYAQAHVALTRARALPGHERDPEVLRVWRELGRHIPRVGLRATWGTAVLKADQSHNLLRTASIAADGSVVVTGHDFSAYLWDVASGNLLNAFSAALANAVGVSADGQQVSVASSPGRNTATADAWSRTRTQLFSRSLPPANAGSALAAMTPDGKRLLWGNGSEIQVRELDTGRRLSSLPGHPLRDTKLWISGDGHTAVTATKDSIRLWDLDDGECQLKLPIPANPLSRLPEPASPFSSLHAVCASPDGKHIVAAGFAAKDLDLTMRMWNIAGETMQNFKCRPASVNAIEFSPDGRFIFVGSSNTVTVHDVETGSPVHTFSGNQGRAENIRLTPDGRYALVWEHMGQVAQVWELDWELEVEQRYSR